MTHNEQSEHNLADTGKSLPQWAAFVSMGISTAVIVALGVIVGIVADGALHTTPLFLFLGLIAGCVIAVLAVVAQMRRFL
jgi:F0F1-type ATP synthase assembly protein I